MIISGAFKSSKHQPENAVKQTYTPAGRYRSTNTITKARQTVTPEGSKAVPTAYRAGNIISDDIAKMPLQLFRKIGGKKEQVDPDYRIRNKPYLLEVSPNRWGWTPFQFKKAAIQWLLYYGNAYIWTPPVWPFEMFILPADTTWPVFDPEGNLWYSTLFAYDKQRTTFQQVYLPAVEVLQLLINPDNTGHVGRGVIEFARETIGRQQGAYETLSNLYAQGMNPSAYIHMQGQLDEKARDKVRESYGEAIGGSKNAYGLAVFDNKVVQFEPISMKLVDAQFLEQTNVSDRDIANFFGMPLHMLNMGKQAYNSNDANYLGYLNGTLDAYLVQFEQAARVKWLSEPDQNDKYFKFIRESLLRMDAKTRAETNEILIRSAQRNPNECREKDDYSAYDRGDEFFMTKNYAEIDKLGEA
jgi:HK97 family phage portal protein